MTNGFPGNVQGVPAVQLAPAPQNAYFQGGQRTQQNVNQTYNAKAGVMTGYIQIGCGVVALVLGIISCVIPTSLYFIGTGIWSGIAFFIVSGILGVASAKRTNCVIISYMVMSILCSVVAGVGIIIYSSDAADRYYWYSRHPEATLAIDILAIFVSFAELVTSITAAAFCCSGNCCPSTAPATGPVVYYYQAPAGYAMPQGMVAFTTTTQHTMGPQPPRAPTLNNFVQQPVSVMQYPGAQPVQVQWQPMPGPQQPMAGPQPVAGQPPTAPQGPSNPTGVQDDQPPQAVEKPPPYN